MKTEDLGNSKILNVLFKPAGMMMGSKVRQWLFDPVKTLQAADVKAGKTILEVGCGTGFFTLPAARLIGDNGCLIAMDPSAGFIEVVAKKVRKADISNVRIVKRDALQTGLTSASIDQALLFGVIPFPLLPLNQLLPEMHRILKPGGTLSVWLFPPLIHFWVPKFILGSGCFHFASKRNGVYNYKRSSLGS